MGRYATVKYKYKGEMLTLAQLMPYSSVHRDTLYQRLRAGWDIDEALTKKVHHIKDPVSVGAVNRELSRSRKKIKLTVFAQCTSRRNSK